jgi:glycosyltransferase involved in cell wall biosynthesis
MGLGCPVVAFNRGAIPVFLHSGVTGFVVEDTDSMVDAVSTINDIDRAACREHALTTFSVASMTDKYEEIYRKMTSSA